MVCEGRWWGCWVSCQRSGKEDEEVQWAAFVVVVGELEGWCCGRGKNGLGFREREGRPGSVGGGEGEGEVETTSEREESGWTALPSFGLGELAASSGGKVWWGRRRWGRLWLGHGERQLEEGSGLGLFFCGFLIYCFSKLPLLSVEWLLFINRILFGLNCSSISFLFFNFDFLI